MSTTFNPLSGQFDIVGSSGGGGGSTLTIETPSGTIDGANTSFTVLNVPLYITIDNLQYTTDTNKASL